MGVLRNPKEPKPSSFLPSIVYCEAGRPESSAMVPLSRAQVAYNNWRSGNGHLNLAPKYTPQRCGASIPMSRPFSTNPFDVANDRHPVASVSAGPSQSNAGMSRSPFRTGQNVPIGVEVDEWVSHNVHDPFAAYSTPKWSPMWQSSEGEVGLSPDWGSSIPMRHPSQSATARKLEFDNLSRVVAEGGGHGFRRDKSIGTNAVQPVAPWRSDARVWRSRAPSPSTTEGRGRSSSAPRKAKAVDKGGSRARSHSVHRASQRPGGDDPTPRQGKSVHFSPDAAATTVEFVESPGEFAYLPPHVYQKSPEKKECRKCGNMAMKFHSHCGMCNGRKFHPIRPVLAEAFADGFVTNRRVASDPTQDDSTVVTPVANGGTVQSNNVPGNNVGRRFGMVPTSNDPESIAEYVSDILAAVEPLSHVPAAQTLQFPHSMLRFSSSLRVQKCRRWLWISLQNVFLYFVKKVSVS